MTLISPVYCTADEVRRLLSPGGVTNFADHNQDGLDDDDVLDDCINQATQEIDAYALQRYAAAGLQSSTLVNRWCVTLAAYFLCQRRNAGAAETLQAEFERIMKLLEMIPTGAYQLPGVAMSSDLRPTMSNRQVDRRFIRQTVRVERTTSTDAPSTLPRNDAIGGYQEMA